MVSQARPRSRCHQPRRSIIPHLYCSRAGAPTEIPRRKPTNRRWKCAQNCPLQRHARVGNTQSPLGAPHFPTICSTYCWSERPIARICCPLCPRSAAALRSGKAMGIFNRGLHAELLVLLPAARVRLAIIRRYPGEGTDHLSKSMGGGRNPCTRAHIDLSSRYSGALLEILGGPGFKNPAAAGFENLDRDIR